jgi:hypothetical protein
MIINLRKRIKNIEYIVSEGVFSFWGNKFYGVTLDVSWDVGRGIRILIKKLIT